MNYDDIKKVIESCHLNFLIGSGASKPYLNTLGSIESLLTDLSKEKDSDQKTIVDASIKKHYFDTAIRGNLHIDSSKDTDLIETKLSYEEFLQSLNIIINKRKSNLVSKQVNLFTTNMDIFLDYTLEKLQLCFNDGFYGRFHPKFGTENFHNVVIKTSTHYEYESKLPLFNIYKMHGSVNWKNGNNKIPNDNTVSYDYGLEVLSSIYNLPLDQNDFIALKYNEGDKDDSKNIQMLMSEKKELTTSHSSFLDAYNKLLIINPTKQKLAITTLELTFYELLRMYSNYLERENSILFVIGFSFADEHIREITKRVAASNPTLLIIIFAYTKNAIDNKMNETQNIKIIYPDNDDCFYSLKEINDNFFKKLSNDLSGKTSSTYTGENLNG